MENVRKKIVEFKENCEMLLDILDNKQQRFQTESEQFLEISKLTRRNAELNFEINKDLLEILCKNIVKETITLKGISLYYEEDKKNI